MILSNSSKQKLRFTRHLNGDGIWVKSRYRPFYFKSVMDYGGGIYVAWNNPKCLYIFRGVTEESKLEKLRRDYEKLGKTIKQIEDEKIKSD